jgi:hypothetical protein
MVAVLGRSAGANKALWGAPWHPDRPSMRRSTRFELFAGYVEDLIRSAPPELFQ